MLMIVDYVMYYVFCLLIYKIGNLLFKQNKSLETFDLYGVGVFSVMFYIYLYTENGFLMMDEFI